MRKLQDSAVFGVPNEDFGEEVKAVVQLEEQFQNADEQTLKDIGNELIEYTKKKIAHYKCPRSIDFVIDFPRLPTGKLYKKPLKAKYWDGHESGVI